MRNHTGLANTFGVCMRVGERERERNESKRERDLVIAGGQHHSERTHPSVGDLDTDNLGRISYFR